MRAHVLIEHRLNGRMDIARSEFSGARKHRDDCTSDLAPRPPQTTSSTSLDLRFRVNLSEPSSDISHPLDQILVRTVPSRAHRTICRYFS